MVAAGDAGNGAASTLPREGWGGGPLGAVGGGAGGGSGGSGGGGDSRDASWSLSNSGSRGRGQW